MDAFFIDTPGGGQRFCVHHLPQGPIKQGQLLYIHPFAEEMNKSRRMAALQARAFASAGYEVLQIDLLGCGDSSGDFGDATWPDWIEDVQRGLTWLRRRGSGAQPIWLWGLRAGCLLAAEVARQSSESLNLLLVQPPASGKLVLQQFLRLKSVAGLMDGSSKGAMTEMRAALSRNERLEIAGYVLNPQMASGLESASLQAPRGPSTQCLVWIELSSNPGATWTPVALQAQKQWAEVGYTIRAELLEGSAYWQTSEIEVVPALIEAGPRQVQAAAVEAGPLNKDRAAV